MSNSCPKKPFAYLMRDINIFNDSNDKSIESPSTVRYILKVLTEFEYEIDKNQTQCKPLTDTDLAQTLVSLSCLAFCVLLIGFFVEAFRLSRLLRKSWKQPDHAIDCPLDKYLISAQQNLLKFHLLAIYSVYFSFIGTNIYLFIPALFQLTHCYFCVAIVKKNRWMENTFSITVKALVLALLTSYCAILLLADSHILELFYEQVAVEFNHNLLTGHLNFIGIVTTVLLLHIIIAFCSLDGHAIEQFPIYSLEHWFNAIDSSKFIRY